MPERDAVPPAVDVGDLSFACPRCTAPVAERFYGPCARCRTELASLGGPGGAAAPVERFEPAMHVVPNHVATKE